MPLNPWYFSLILPAWYQCCKEPVPWSLYHRPLHLPLLHHRLLLDKYNPHQKARSYLSHWWSAGYLRSQEMCIRYRSFCLPERSLSCLKLTFFQQYILIKLVQDVYKRQPKRVLMDTSNSFDNNFKVSVLGTVSPFSQRDTACRVTITFCANSS